MRLPSLTFGRLTILGPSVRQALEEELKDYVSRPAGQRKHYSSNVTNRLRQESGDPNLTIQNFIPDSADRNGIYCKPNGSNTPKGIPCGINFKALAGLFPLPNGAGLVVTNHSAHADDVFHHREQLPFEDLNHLQIMLQDTYGDPTDQVVQRYLRHEIERTHPDLEGKPGLIRKPDVKYILS